MKDLIDREKALDCFHDWVDKHGDVHTADEMTEYQAIEALPTEKSLCALCQYNDLEWDEEPCDSCTMGGENNHFKAVERWIPVSERLPKENIPVLLGIRFKDDFKYFVTTRMDYNYWTGLGRDIRGKLVWMPLPEPYKERREE